METQRSIPALNASAPRINAIGAEPALAAARLGVSRMRLVAGHPALDFVNTQSGPAGGELEDDTIHSYAELLAWAEYVGIMRPAEVERLFAGGAERPATARDVLRRAISLRAALRTLFDGIASGSDQGAESLEIVAATERDALARAVLTPGGSGFEWSWPDADDLARPLWTVAHAAVELLLAGPLDRLKACGGCRFLFVDESKNKSRRWCAMADCGTVAKSRLYVTRRAERRAEQRAERAPRST